MKLMMYHYSVKLENCVLSNGVQIRDRAVLKDCELGRDVIIEADGTSSAFQSHPFSSTADVLLFALDNHTASIKNEQLVVELD